MIFQSAIGHRFGGLSLSIHAHMHAWLRAAPWASGLPQILVTVSAASGRILNLQKGWGGEGRPLHIGHRFGGLRPPEPLQTCTYACVAARGSLGLWSPSGIGHRSYPRRGLVALLCF